MTNKNADQRSCRWYLFLLCCKQEYVYEKKKKRMINVYSQLQYRKCSSSDNWLSERVVTLQYLFLMKQGEDHTINESGPFCIISGKAFTHTHTHLLCLAQLQSSCSPAAKSFSYPSLLPPSENTPALLALYPFIVGFLEAKDVREFWLVSEVWIIMG